MVVALFVPNPLWLPAALVALATFVFVARAARGSVGNDDGPQKRVQLIAVACVCALAGVLGLAVEHVPLAWDLTADFEFQRFDYVPLSAGWPGFVSDVAPYLIWSGCASFLAVALASFTERRGSKTRAV